MVVIITDGESRMARRQWLLPSHCQSKNVTVFAIGIERFIVGSCASASTTTPAATTTTTLTTTTTQSSTTTTTTPTTTTTIPTTTTPTTTTTIPTTTTTTPTTMTTTSTSETTEPNDIQGDTDTAACINRPADVYFVLDSSSSIWVHDFETSMLQFVRNVIDIYDIGADRTRVGIITFSDKPRTVFGLEAHVQKEELLKAVNSKSVKYEPGLTYTAEALQTARMNLFQEGRQNADHVLILITDGQSKDPNATLMTARAAHEDGVTVFTVGVGSGVDVGELHGVASKPSEDFTFMVDDFKGLDSYKAILAARTCGANATLVPPILTLFCSLQDESCRHHFRVRLEHAGRRRVDSDHFHYSSRFRYF
ncbi:collagen alpha-1(XXII) chain-like [Pomacea canaliculata]|uniref:collagen alpha-1(XXII) chain-like n=1 Tax=Pomacea canaliculata TaxID=400727 RepID=UPI000D739D44|nr:collagen alpha-1(XXII) chain-like [Pomacea canaliculata]